tara:strand:- start:1931 stop:2488 length:558 start_codon:yes stop_codon:yes gene_type:complete
METKTMSNILNNVIALKSIKDAWNAKLGGEAKFATHLDVVTQHMRWTDCVAATKNNLASGKSTATKESRAELVALFAKVLKAKGRAHDSAACGSEIGDLKDALMLRQAPELYAETNGNLGKIEGVENGAATVKEKPADKTTIEMRDQLLTNVKNWAEKNKDALGNDYTPTRKAILAAMETLSIKR